MIPAYTPPRRMAILDAAYNGHKYVYQFPPNLAGDIAKQIILEAADPDHPMPWRVAGGLLASLSSLACVRRAGGRVIRETTCRAADPGDPMTWHDAVAIHNEIRKHIGETL